MTTKFTRELFGTTYKDDFKDSDNYHRVLFNSGRALQARELTQMQTIIQKEMERFGRNIFKEGASVVPGGYVINTRYEFIKLDTSTFALPTDPNTLALMINDEFTGQTSGIKFKVLQVEAATGTDPATIFGVYTSTTGGSSGSAPIRMTPGENIVSTNSVTLTVQTTDISTNRPTGVGCKISVNEGSFFVQGHFVFCNPQSIILSKYDNKPSAVVGFKVEQDVVTASDNSALYDNAGATLNTAAPGADRYRIRLTLTTEDQIGATDNFVYFCRVMFGNVFDVVTGRDEYNKIEENIARRTDEIHGDFFLRPFKVGYRLDSASTHLQAEISPGLAYVNGFRAATDYPTKIRIPKAQTTIAFNNEVAAVGYGNYVKVTNVKGIPEINTMERQNLQDAITLGGNTIGTARVRAVEKDGIYQRYYLFDIKMNDGAAFNSVKSIGVSATQHADITNSLGANNGIPVLYEPNKNAALFGLRYPRPKTLSDISLQVQRRFTGTSDGSGNLTLTLTSPGETFVSTTEWIVVDTSSGNDIAATYGAAGSNAITLGNLGATNAVIIHAKVNKAQGASRTKTLTSEIITANIDSLGGGLKAVNLQKSDVFEIDSVRAVDSLGLDISQSFILDNGQRDNFYGNGRLILADNSSLSGNVYVNFKYYTHGATGDFFSANSYTGQVDYGRIGQHTSNDGAPVDLVNVLDFRPRAGNNDSNFNSTGSVINEFPDANDVVQFDVDYYLPRLDRLVINQEGDILNKQGVPQLDPKFPPLANDEMLLADTRLNPFTFNDSDTSIAHYESKIYSMRDIGRMEAKLDQLFEMTTLNMVETGVDNVSSLDSSGNDRTKAGFLVDNFTNHTSSAIRNIEYRAAIDPLAKELRPTGIEENIRVMYDSALSTNTIIKGDNVYKSYHDSAWISQLQVSQTENINPFAVITHLGILELSPASDDWKETVAIADNVISGGTENRFSGDQAQLFSNSQWNWAGEEVGATRSQQLSTTQADTGRTFGSTETVMAEGTDGNWNTVTATEHVRVHAEWASTTRTATARVDSFSTIREIVGNRVLNVAVIPFMRSRSISFRAQGLKANTRFYPFFDGVDVSSWCRATAFTRHAVQDNEMGDRYVNLTTNPNGTTSLISDAEGKIEGEFFIPNRPDQRFRTGTREFKLLDITVDNEEEASSFAVFPYIASGAIETVENQIRSTRVRNIVTGVRSDVTMGSTVTGTSSSIVGTSRINRVTGASEGTGILTPRQVDPLAQSFFVPEQEGAFLTKVDIWFKTRDDVVPVQMQIRPVVNGHPSSSDIVPGSIKFLSPSSVFVTNDPVSDPENTKTQFTFDEPVYLAPYKEYAVVLIAESTQYEVYVAQTEEFILGSTEKRITTQPSLGSLFKSQNTSTWTADQTKDMMFRLHRAVFSTDPSIAVLENAATPPRALANNPMTTTAGSNTVRIAHKDHGFIVGDRVVLSGFDSASTYAGISGATLNGLKIISGGDVDNFELNAGSAADSDKVVGGSTIRTTQNYKYEQLYPYIETNIPPNTNISLTGRLMSGQSAAGAESPYAKDAFDISLALRANNYFTVPKLVADRTVESQRLTGANKSATLNVSMTSNSNYVSPVLDMQRAAMWLTHNRVDNQASGAATGFNVPYTYVPETNKTGGTSLAKHITRPVTMTTSAAGLKIILSANKPSVANFVVYYKVSTSDISFDDLSWNVISPERTMPSDDDPTIFRDYEYLVGGIGGLAETFTKFQLKIVMRTSNNARPPRFKDLRVIALVV